MISFENRSKLSRAVVVAYVISTFCLAISTFVAAGKCYTSPCMEGRGLDVLWKVGKGMGFTVRVACG
jgi:hypothetical protein